LSAEIKRNGQDHRKRNSLYNRHWGKNRGEYHEIKKQKRIPFKKTALETAYFLAIVNRALMELATRLEQVAKIADNFSFRYDPEKFKEIKEEALKTHYMNVYTALSDGL